MHNIGRTVHEMHEANEFEQEFEQEFENEFEQESYETGEFGSILSNIFGETQGEQEFEHEHEFEQEFEQEYEQEQESPFNETAEMELASELLEVQNEQELEQFLGKLVRGATRAVGNFARSKAGRALGGALKGVARVALPVAGKALGGMFGGPLGSMVGGKLAGLAGKAFGLELEGLSAEDREFEVSRAFVRFAGNAARRASRNNNWQRQPRQTVRNALVKAARNHAPGLLTPMNAVAGGNGYQDDDMDGGGGGPITSRRSGRWTKRGNTIVLYGI